MPKTKERHKKDPARVAAGKRAWARMSASAKEKVVARLRPFRKKGRAFHGGARQTKSAGPSKASHTSSGGGSTKSAPKPRLAIWGGAIASAGALAGVEGMRPAGFYELPTKRGSTLVSQATANVGKATTTLSGAVAVAAPTLIGTLISVGAD